MMLDCFANARSDASACDVLTRCVLFHPHPLLAFLLRVCVVVVLFLFGFISPERNDYNRDYTFRS